MKTEEDVKSSSIYSDQFISARGTKEKIEKPYVDVQEDKINMNSFSSNESPYRESGVVTDPFIREKLAKAQASIKSGDPYQSLAKENA